MILVAHLQGGLHPNLLKKRIKIQANQVLERDFTAVQTNWRVSFESTSTFFSRVNDYNDYIDTADFVSVYSERVRSKLECISMSKFTGRKLESMCKLL